MSLEQTQKRLWRLIAWPEGVRPALQTEPEGTPDLATLVTSDERLAAEDRLDVYANAYFYRIHDVLAEDFPTLAAALGEEGFHDLVTSYLAVHPSQSPSLRWIGDRLAEFITGHASVASLRRASPFAADLATYEWTTEAIFDAQDSQPARREDLASVPAEDWDQLMVQLRPSVRLLRLGWPVQELRSAMRAEEPLPEIEPAATALCLWRRDEQVVHRELDPREAQALEAAASGVAFGLLCERVAREVGEDEAPSLAATWLASWIDDGLVLSRSAPGAGIS